MGTEKITEWICDTCKKTVRVSESNPMIGGSPVLGWIKMNRIERGKMFWMSENKGPWTFCSVNCACDFLGKAKVMNLEYKFEDFDDFIHSYDGDRRGFAYPIVQRAWNAAREVK